MLPPAPRKYQTMEKLRSVEKAEREELEWFWVGFNVDISLLKVPSHDIRKKIKLDLRIVKSLL